MPTSCQVLLQNAPSYILQGSWIGLWENYPTIKVVLPKTFLKQIIFFSTKHPQADEST